MKLVKKVFIGLILLTLILPTILPMQTVAAEQKYGVIIGDKNNNYKLYQDLVVLSPSKNIMLKAYTTSRRLGLTYSYDKALKKLTIANPYNGKSIVYISGKKEFTYYSSKTAKGSVKTAINKFYYDSATKSYVIHASTLQYIVGYNYYKNIQDSYYTQMGYKGILSFSTKGYKSKEIPITTEVVNYFNKKTFTSKEELLDVVRLNLMARNPSFTLKTNRGVMKDVGSSKSIYSIIKNLDSTDTSKDADYLTLLVDQFSQQWRSTSTVKISPDGTRTVIETDQDAASLTLNVKYETTLKQERAVDNKIGSVLKELKLEGASDYEKVKKIHDYIINLAKYDITYQNSTTYDLFFKKSSVCEGYALAAYRMFVDAGLESRIIVGNGKGEPHAWNIVKVDGKWYNIDLTWDDPITNTGKQVLRYDYFLKNTKDFTDHQRNDEYNTREFGTKYPIASKSYVIPQ